MAQLLLLVLDMYRAVAEAVSGLRVFANGKWLTCIGNKNVRVGDRIWTDGRCVYGFFKESQNPIVITTPKKADDWGIPIMLKSGQSYTFIRSLKDEPEYTGPDAIEYFVNTESGKCYTVYDHNGRGLDMLAANVDADNNIYIMYSVFTSDPVDQRSTRRMIVIEKNGEVIKKIDTGAKNEESAALSYMQPYLNTKQYTNGRATGTRYRIIIYGEGRLLISRMGSTLFPDERVYWALENSRLEVITQPITVEEHFPPSIRSGNACIWGFIEDENNWSVIMYSTASCTAGLTKIPDGGEYLYHPNGLTTVWLNNLMIGSALTDSSAVYLKQCSNGITTDKLLWERGYSEVGFGVNTEIAGIFDGKELYPLFYEKFRAKAGLPKLTKSADLNHTEKKIGPDNFTQFKYPLQDGYFFKINYTKKVSPDFLAMPDLVNITLYTPDNAKIVTETFYAFPKITIHKTATNTFIIGVKNRRISIYDEVDGYVKDGFYICEKGELQQILNEPPINERFRPIKNYKKWSDNVQFVYFEDVRRGKK